MALRSLLDMTSDGSAPARRAAWVSAGSFVVHAAAVGSLIAASYLHVEPLAGPPAIGVILITTPPDPPPPPPPPPPASGRMESGRKDPEQGPVEIAEVAQPAALDEEAPGAEAPAEDQGTDEGADGGVPGGIPGGIPGGQPGGMINGVINGVLGSPWRGALTGLPVQDQPLHLTEDLRPPERTIFVQPLYPEMARLARAEGRVILQIVVGRDGSVEEVTVVDSHPLFVQAAIEAVRKWRYSPAIRNGHPVRVYLTIRVVFDLR